MNKIYKNIWNPSRNAYVTVSEIKKFKVACLATSLSIVMLSPGTVLGSTTVLNADNAAYEEYINSLLYHSHYLDNINDSSRDFIVEDHFSRIYLYYAGITANWSTINTVIGNYSSTTSNHDSIVNVIFLNGRRVNDAPISFGGSVNLTAQNMTFSSERNAIKNNGLVVVGICDYNLGGGVTGNLNIKDRLILGIDDIINPDIHSSLTLLNKSISPHTTTAASANAEIKNLIVNKSGKVTLIHGNQYRDSNGNSIRNLANLKVTNAEIKGSFDQYVAGLDSVSVEVRNDPLGGQSASAYFENLKLFDTSKFTISSHLKVGTLMEPDEYVNSGNIWVTNLKLQGSQIYFDLPSHSGIEQTGGTITIEAHGTKESFLNNYVQQSGSLTINQGATFHGQGLTIKGRIVNSGTFKVTTGGMTLGGELINNGTTTLSSLTSVDPESDKNKGQITNNKTLTVNGGVYDGSVQNNHQFISQNTTFRGQFVNAKSDQGGLSGNANSFKNLTNFGTAYLTNVSILAGGSLFNTGSFTGVNAQIYSAINNKNIVTLSNAIIGARIDNGKTLKIQGTNGTFDASNLNNVIDTSIGQDPQIIFENSYHVTTGEIINIVKSQGNLSLSSGSLTNNATWEHNKNLAQETGLNIAKLVNNGTWNLFSGLATITNFDNAGVVDASKITISDSLNNSNSITATELTVNNGATVNNSQADGNAATPNFKLVNLTVNGTFNNTDGSTTVDNQLSVNKTFNNKTVLKAKYVTIDTNALLDNTEGSSADLADLKIESAGTYNNAGEHTNITGLVTIDKGGTYINKAESNIKNLTLDGTFDNTASLVVDGFINSSAYSKKDGVLNNTGSAIITSSSLQKYYGSINNTEDAQLTVTGGVYGGAINHSSSKEATFNSVFFGDSEINTRALLTNDVDSKIVGNHNTLNRYGTIDNNGEIEFSNFDISGTINNKNLLTIEGVQIRENGVINNDKLVTIKGLIDEGSIFCTSGLVNNDLDARFILQETLNSIGTFNLEKGFLTNEGEWTHTQGKVTLHKTDNLGTVNIQSENTLIADNIDNSGDIAIVSGSMVENATFMNQRGATATLNNLVTSGDIKNYGVLNSNSLTVRETGKVYNGDEEGNGSKATATLTDLTVDGLYKNYGLFTHVGGQLKVNKAFTNGSEFEASHSYIGNTGTFDNLEDHSATLYDAEVRGTLNNRGTANLTNLRSVGTDGSNGLINNFSTLTIKSELDNIYYGILENNESAVLDIDGGQFAGQVNNSSNETMVLKNAKVSGSLFNSNNSTIEGSLNELPLGGSIDNEGTIDFNGFTSAGNIENKGEFIVGNVSVAGGSIKNSGMFVVKGQKEGGSFNLRALSNETDTAEYLFQGNISSSGTLNLSQGSLLNEGTWKHTGDEAGNLSVANLVNDGTIEVSNNRFKVGTFDNNNSAEINAEIIIDGVLTNSDHLKHRGKLTFTSSTSSLVLKRDSLYDVAPYNNIYDDFGDVVKPTFNFQRLSDLALDSKDTNYFLQVNSVGQVNEDFRTHASVELGARIYIDDPITNSLSLLQQGLLQDIFKEAMGAGEVEFAQHGNSETQAGVLNVKKVNELYQKEDWARGIVYLHILEGQDKDVVLSPDDTTEILTDQLTHSTGFKGINKAKSVEVLGGGTLYLVGDTVPTDSDEPYVMSSADIVVQDEGSVLSLGSDGLPNGYSGEVSNVNVSKGGKVKVTNGTYKISSLSQKGNVPALEVGSDLSKATLTINSMETEGGVKIFSGSSLVLKAVESDDTLPMFTAGVLEMIAPKTGSVTSLVVDGNLNTKQVEASGANVSLKRGTLLSGTGWFENSTITLTDGAKIDARSIKDRSGNDSFNLGNNTYILSGTGMVPEGYAGTAPDNSNVHPAWSTDWREGFTHLIAVTLTSATDVTVNTGALLSVENLELDGSKMSIHLKGGALEISASEIFDNIAGPEIEIPTESTTELVNRYSLASVGAVKESVTGGIEVGKSADRKSSSWLVFNDNAIWVSGVESILKELRKGRLLTTSNRLKVEFSGNIIDNFTVDNLNDLAELTPEEIVFTQTALINNQAGEEKSRLFIGSSTEGDDPDANYAKLNTPFGFTQVKKAQEVVVEDSAKFVLLGKEQTRSTVTFDETNNLLPDSEGQGKLIAAGTIYLGGSRDNYRHSGWVDSADVEDGGQLNVRRGDYKISDVINDGNVSLSNASTLEINKLSGSGQIEIGEGTKLKLDIDGEENSQGSIVNLGEIESGSLANLTVNNLVTNQGASSSFNKLTTTESSINRGTETGKSWEVNGEATIEDGGQSQWDQIAVTEGSVVDNQGSLLVKDLVAEVGSEINNKSNLTVANAGQITLKSQSGEGSELTNSGFIARAENASDTAILVEGGGLSNISGGSISLNSLTIQSGFVENQAGAIIEVDNVTLESGSLENEGAKAGIDAARISTGSLVQSGGTVSNSGTIEANSAHVAAGTFENLTGANTLGSTLTIGSEEPGTVEFINEGNVGLQENAYSSLELLSGNLHNESGAAIYTESFTQKGGQTVNAGKTFYSGTALIEGGSFINEADGLSGNSLTVNKEGSFDNQANAEFGSVNIDGKAKNEGTITFTESFTVGAAAKDLTGNTPFVNNGTIIQNPSASTEASGMSLENGAQFENRGEISVGSFAQNESTTFTNTDKFATDSINLSSGSSYVASSDHNTWLSGTLAEGSSVTVDGSLSVGSDDKTVSTAADIENNGSLTIAQGSVFENSGSINNTGSIRVGQSASVDNAGSINNTGSITVGQAGFVENSGSISGEGSITLGDNAKLINTSSITASDYSAGLESEFHQSGLSAKVQVAEGGTWFNNTTIYVEKGAELRDTDLDGNLGKGNNYIIESDNPTPTVRYRVEKDEFNRKVNVPFYYEYEDFELQALSRLIVQEINSDNTYNIRRGGYLDVGTINLSVNSKTLVLEGGILRTSMSQIFDNPTAADLHGVKSSINNGMEFSSGYLVFDDPSYTLAQVQQASQIFKDKTTASSGIAFLGETNPIKELLVSEAKDDEKFPGYTEIILPQAKLINDQPDGGHPDFEEDGHEKIVIGNKSEEHNRWEITAPFTVKNVEKIHIIEIQDGRQFGLVGYVSGAKDVAPSGDKRIFLDCDIGGTVRVINGTFNLGHDTVGVREGWIGNAELYSKGVFDVVVGNYEVRNIKNNGLFRINEGAVLRTSNYSDEAGQLQEKEGTERQAGALENYGSFIYTGENIGFDIKGSFRNYGQTDFNQAESLTVSGTLQDFSGINLTGVASDPEAAPVALRDIEVKAAGLVENYALHQGRELKVQEGGQYFAAANATHSGDSQWHDIKLDGVVGAYKGSSFTAVGSLEGSGVVENYGSFDATQVAQSNIGGIRTAVDSTSTFKDLSLSKDSRPEGSFISSNQGRMDVDGVFNLKEGHTFVQTENGDLKVNELKLDQGSVLQNLGKVYVRSEKSDMTIEGQVINRGYFEAKSVDTFHIGSENKVASFTTLQSANNGDGSFFKNVVVENGSTFNSSGITKGERLNVLGEATYNVNRGGDDLWQNIDLTGTINVYNGGKLTVDQENGALVVHNGYRIYIEKGGEIDARLEKDSAKVEGELINEGKASFNTLEIGNGATSLNTQTGNQSGHVLYVASGSTGHRSDGTSVWDIVRNYEPLTNNGDFTVKNSYEAGADIVNGANGTFRAKNVQLITTAHNIVNEGRAEFNDLTLGQAYEHFDPKTATDPVELANSQPENSEITSELSAQVANSESDSHFTNRGVVDGHNLTVESGGLYTNEKGTSQWKQVSVQEDGRFETGGDFFVDKLILGSESDHIMRAVASPYAAFTQGRSVIDEAELNSGVFRVPRPEDQGGAASVTINTVSTPVGASIRVLPSGDLGFGANAISEADFRGAIAPSSSVARVSISTPVTFNQYGTMYVGTSEENANNSSATGLFFDNGSALVLNLSELGQDGALIAEEGSDRTLKVSSEAELYVNLAGAKKGNYYITRNFDNSENRDDAGNWTGGWDGEQMIAIPRNSVAGWKLFFHQDAYNTWLEATVSQTPDVAAPEVAQDIIEGDDPKNPGEEFVIKALTDDTTDIDKAKLAYNSLVNLAFSGGQLATAYSSMNAAVNSIETRTSMRAEGFNSRGWVANKNRNGDLWIDTLGRIERVDGYDATKIDKAGFESKSYGFIMGADHLFAEQNLLTGVAVSYQDGTVKSRGAVSSTKNEFNTFGAQVYGYWSPNPIVNVAFDAGYYQNHADIKQDISGVATGFSQAKAKAKTHMSSVGVRLESTLKAEDVSIIPHVGVRWNVTKTESYVTKVEGVSSFKNDPHSTHNVQFPIGVTLRGDIATKSGWKFRPTVDATAMLQAGARYQKVIFSGMDSPVSSTIYGRFTGAYAFVGSVGLQAEKNDFTLGLRYGVTAGSGGKLDQQLKIEAVWRF